MYPVTSSTYPLISLATELHATTIYISDLMRHARSMG